MTTGKAFMITKLRLTCSLLGLFTVLINLQSQEEQLIYIPSSTRVLSYDQPADLWIEALPIGNGRLGGMVYGGTHEEII